MNGYIICYYGPTVVLLYWYHLLWALNLKVIYTQLAEVCKECFFHPGRKRFASQIESKLYLPKRTNSITYIFVSYFLTSFSLVLLRPKQ